MKQTAVGGRQEFTAAWVADCVLFNGLPA